MDQNGSSVNAAGSRSGRRFGDGAMARTNDGGGPSPSTSRNGWNPRPPQNGPSYSFGGQRSSNRLPFQSRPSLNRAPSPFYNRPALPSPLPMQFLPGPPLFMPHSLPRPTLNVYPDQVINFSKCYISFKVQAINLPPGVPSYSYRMEGLVVAPGGNFIPCRIRHEMRRNMYEPDSFVGSFQSTDEVGLYHLRVRLLPPALLPMEPVIEDDVFLLISRNYHKESMTDSPISFQVEFQPLSPTNSPQSDVGELSSSASKLWGLSCDKGTNRLFYTDRSGNSFSCVDSERGETIFKVPRSNLTAHNLAFQRPTGIFCDEAHRRLILCDKDNHRVCTFSMDGEFLSSFGSYGHGNGEFNYPWDVAVTQDGSKIAVTDSQNKRLQLFDRNGNYLNKFTIYERNPFEFKDNFDQPRGVAFNKDGTMIYVTDFNVNNIIEIPLDMQSHRKLLSEGQQQPSRLQWKLNRPQGITLDSMDGILVCDARNRSVLHVYPDGEVLTQIGRIGGNRLEFPTNVTLMGDGRLVVLDSHATNKISIF